MCRSFPGGAGYIHNVSGGVQTLEPQIDPVLLVPFGRHLLLESRTDFTGFFERQNLTSGPFKGKVFKDVEYAQLDWLADSHAIVVGGRYLLPFGLYNERLEPDLDSQSAGLAIHGEHRDAHQRGRRRVDAARGRGSNPGHDTAVLSLFLSSERD